VVSSQLPLTPLIRLSQGIQGLASFVFVDLGESFEVKDTTGEPSPTVMVESITQVCGRSLAPVFFSYSIAGKVV
jgi:hypothetical protein